MVGPEVRVGGARGAHHGCGRTDTMKTALLTTFGLTFTLTAADIVLPDACDGHVCLTELRWKKGAVEHTLTGVVSSPDPISSINIVFTYADGHKRGNMRLGLVDRKSTRLNSSHLGI